jgi:hypothetical protein
MSMALGILVNAPADRQRGSQCASKTAHFTGDLGHPTHPPALVRTEHNNMAHEKQLENNFKSTLKSKLNT